MNRELIKKTAAVILSMVMAFGAVSVLPDNIVQDNAIVASAETYAANDCIFSYSTDIKADNKSVVITGVEILNDTGTVEIPSTITRYGTEYPVGRIDNDFLRDDQTVYRIMRFM